MGEVLRAVTGRLWMHGALLLAGSLTASCASLPPKQLPDALRAPPPAQALAALRGSAAVVVSYPSAITPAALPQAVQFYDAATIGTTPPVDVLGAFSGRNPRMIEDALGRTPYFAHEYVQALMRALPGVPVIALPGTVDLRDGQLVYRTADVSVPVAMRVDLLAYQGTHMHLGRPWTGSTLPELTLVLEARAATAHTRVPQGILLANAELPLIATHGPNNAPSVLLSLFSKGAKQPGLSLQLAQQPADPARGVALPVVTSWIPDDEVALHAATGDTPAALAGQMVVDLAHLTAHALLKVDQREVRQSGLAGQLRFYDSRLAPRDLADTDPRWQMVAQFAALETQVLAEARTDLLRGAYPGPWGRAWRDRFVAEVAAWKRTTQTMLASSLSSMALIGQPATFGSVAAQFQGITQLSRDVATLGEGTQASFEQLDLKQRRVTGQIADMAVSLTASSIGELRQRFKSLYDAQFPLK